MKCCIDFLVVSPDFSRHSQTSYILAFVHSHSSLPVVLRVDTAEPRVKCLGKHDHDRRGHDSDHSASNMNMSMLQPALFVSMCIAEREREREITML